MKNKILVVDDDIAICELLTDVLSEHVFEVRSCHLAQAALHTLQQEPDIALVLLDLMLPDLNGYQILNEKAKDPTIREIPVVIVSSNDPVGTQVISSQFAIRRSSGLSVQEFLECILALTGTLNAELQKSDPLLPETSPE